MQLAVPGANLVRNSLQVQHHLDLKLRLDLKLHLKLKLRRKPLALILQAPFLEMPRQISDKKNGLPHLKIVII